MAWWYGRLFAFEELPPIAAMSPYGNSQRMPATLFVKSVEFKPEMDFHTERTTSIDLEVNMIDAQKIVDELKKRLEHQNGGSVRIRFTGRLVL